VLALRHPSNGTVVTVVMARRVRTLPIASAGREKVTISDRDWQRIERAYGQKLSLEVRGDIHEKTQEFVDRAEFEQNAEPVSDARDRISTIIRAAGSLRSALDGGDHDADSHARTLIKKHLKKKGDAIKKRRRKKDDPLRNISSGVRLLIFASQDALREFDDVKTVAGKLAQALADMKMGVVGAEERCRQWQLEFDRLRAKSLNQGFNKGEAWERWIVRLTSIAEKHGLPWRVRKDSDKQSDQSPFVELIWELQQSVPKAHRRYSRGALAGAIVGARRQNRVG
jgi:hypothetical protein